MVSTLEQLQVPNGTGPGVRRSKRPLLASCTRCNVLWKPPEFGNKRKGRDLTQTYDKSHHTNRNFKRVTQQKVKIGNKVQFGNKFENWWNVWSIEGIIVYGHGPGCHVTLGRGRHLNFAFFKNVLTSLHVKTCRIFAVMWKAYAL